MSKETKSLSHISIEKVICHGNLVVLIVPRADVPNVVGKRGKIIDEVKKCSGKQVKVVGREDRKTMITWLMFPARLVGVGSLYSNGVESIKIGIKKSELRNLPADKDDLIHAAAEMSGMGVSFAIV
jgi:transcription antitermination factor NusA-like protein